MSGASLKDYDPFQPKPMARHYNVHPEAETRKLRRPLCGATSADGRGVAGGYYTNDVELVTCKRCLKRFEAQLDAIVTQYAKDLAKLRKAQEAIERTRRASSRFPGE